MLALKLGQSLSSSNTPSGAGFSNEYSINFDGIDDRLTSSADSTLADASYSFWIKSSVTGINRGVFGHGGYNTGAFHFNYVTPALLYMGGAYKGWSGVSGGASLTAQQDGNWHHWVVYVDSSDITGCKLYVDGVLQTNNSTAGSGINAYTEAITIGADTQVGGQEYNGSIDEFAWFTSELSQAQVTEIYNSGLPTDLTGMTDLAGYWRMGDPNGQSSYDTITDDSSNSNDATMINMLATDIVTDVPT